MPRASRHGPDAGTSGVTADGGGHQATPGDDAAAGAACEGTCALLVRRLDQILDWLQQIAYQQTPQTKERAAYVEGLKQVMDGTK